MINIDWRVRLTGGIIMLIVSGFAIKFALDLRANGEDFNQFVILAMLAIWGGCDWILKGIQKES